MDVLIFLLYWFLRWEISGRTSVFFFQWCFIQEFFKIAQSILMYSPSICFIKSMWCMYTVVLAQAQLERTPVLFYLRVNLLLVVYVFVLRRLTILSLASEVYEFVNKFYRSSTQNGDCSFWFWTDEFCFINVHIEATASSLVVYPERIRKVYLRNAVNNLRSLHQL